MSPTMGGTTWVYDPHSGGTKIPDRVKDRTRQRILKHAEAHYAGKYRSIQVRFRAQFCYIDAYTEPQLSGDYDPQLIGMSREQYIEQMRSTPMRPCRLRYFGNENRWSMDFYTYSHEKYEPCILNDGDWICQHGVSAEHNQKMPLHRRVIRADGNFRYTSVK